MIERFACVVLAALLCAGATAADNRKAAAKHKAPPPPPQPVELTGTVTRVIDGDTLWLKGAADAEPKVIRIEGIDAPESCQPGGAEATTALNELVLNRTVTVKVSAQDDYGRTVGKVFDGEVDVGDRMVRDGRAWSLRFKYDRGPYMAEERMALALKRGLHADGSAINPGEFRKQHGPCAGAPGGVISKPVVATPAALPAAPSALPAAAARRCDGRLYCSQMTSCEEAKWFVKNCPGVKMDGNRDGVPCEKQWCGAR
jgi:endonuclease YncB( thermonuclease family)